MLLYLLSPSDPRHYSLGVNTICDSNCYTMGIFSTVADLSKLLTRLLVLATADNLMEVGMAASDDNQWLNATTVQSFTKVQRQPELQSAGCLNDPSVSV